MNFEQTQFGAEPPRTLPLVTQDPNMNKKALVYFLVAGLSFWWLLRKKK
jgi:hypothetical protein